MVARRMTYRRRKARTGPKRGYRTYRKSGIRNRRRPQNYKGVVSFKRVVQLSNINIGVASQNLQYSFDLGGLPNATEFTSLYDAYKIKCVVLKIVPQYSEAAINGAIPVTPLHSVIDTSDAAPLSLLADYLQYSTYKMTRGLTMHTRKIYPKFLDIVDDGGSAVVGEIKNGWLRTESPNIDHLGMKLFVPASVTGTAYNAAYSVFATYYIQCKNTK